MEQCFWRAEVVSWYKADGVVGDYKATFRDKTRLHGFQGPLLVYYVSYLLLPSRAINIYILRKVIAIRIAKYAKHILYTIILQIYLHGPHISITYVYQLLYKYYISLQVQFTTIISIEIIYELVQFVILFSLFYSLRIKNFKASEFKYQSIANNIFRMKSRRHSSEFKFLRVLTTSESFLQSFSTCLQCGRYQMLTTCCPLLDKTSRGSFLSFLR